MAEVRLSLEEYEALVSRGMAPAGKKKFPEGQNPFVKPKRKGTPLRGMAAALKKANAKARKKNGDFKKGWNQARVMKEAHRIRRRSK